MMERSGGGVEDRVGNSGTKDDISSGGRGKKKVNKRKK